MGTEPKMRTDVFFKKANQLCTTQKKENDSVVGLYSSLRMRIIAFDSIDRGQYSIGRSIDQ